MRALLSRLCRDRSGNNMIELALVAPFIIAITLGVIDFGRGAHASMSLRSAARVGAEYVSRTGDLDKVTAVVTEAAQLKASTLVVTSNMFCECEGTGSATCGTYCRDGTIARRFISITTEQNFSTLFPYPFVDNPMHLSGRAILRVQ
jgi:Flp pilus assembly protein TadG